VPAADVDGVGAVEDPVPPVEVVYHNNPVPDAVNVDAVAFWQYITGVVTTGAKGAVLTVRIAAVEVVGHIFVLSETTHLK
jgi:hypothetical protein